MDTELVLQLRDGEFKSGEVLGAELGISRAAVWKRVERLSGYGLNIERVRGKGYRLPGGVELLDQEVLAAASNDVGVAVEVLMTTGSTNADAMTAFQSSRALPFAILAEHQSAGRGRRGRSWVSPFAGNLYLSLAWKFSVGATQLQGLSLAVGVVVAEVLANAGLGERVQLKWPNDIWVDGRKIGGVLIELAGDFEEACVAVIGIGVNGRLAQQQADAIDQPWTDFFRETGSSMPRNNIAQALLNGLAVMLENFPGNEQWRDRWLALDALRGQPVMLATASDNIFGVAQGIDASGALKLEVGGEVRMIHGGEISLRPVSSVAETSQ